MATITYREECRRYICSVWDESKIYTYKDVEYLAVDMDVSLEYLKGLLKELNLVYLSENEMKRLKREKYLVNVWAKTPLKSRPTIGDIAKKFHTVDSVISNDITRLGLEKYILSSSDIHWREREKEKERLITELKEYYREYKRTGRQYSCEELALKLKGDLRDVRLTIKDNRLSAMIKPYQENCSKSQRMSYYKLNKDILRKNIISNLPHLSVKFGIPISQVKTELINAGVVRSFSVIDTIDSSIDDMYSEPSDYRMSYEELNRTLGVPKGTFRSESYDY